jgi:hypothetical protein
MLMKWENFGAFLSRFLRWVIFLTGDILKEFYCTFIFVLVEGGGFETEKGQTSEIS